MSPHDDDLELPPELRAVEEALRAGRDCAPTTDLAAAARARAEAADRADERQDEPEVSARPLPHRAMRCVVCHDGLSPKQAALCAACLAPHHDDCFATHGRCAAPGCATTRWVRARPERRWVPLAAFGLGAALVSVAALAPRLVAATPMAPPAPTEPPPPPATTTGAPPPAPRLLALALDDLRARLRDDPQPDWAAITSALRVIEPDATTSEERVALRRLLEECETNARDEASYQRAVDIVGTRDVESYPEAQRLLEQVDRRSRIYPDAQAYVQWIDADLEVRQAETAYKLGEERRAFKLLSEALDHEVLGPEARNSVRARRQRWGRVVTAYNRGRELYLAGRTLEAQEEFQRVIQLEPDRQNRYHTRAVAELKHIQSVMGLNLEAKLRAGLEALEGGQYADAFRHFGEVTRDAATQPRDLQRIEDAVVEADRSRRLLKNAQRDFIADNAEKFLDIFYITKLLRRWLPDGHGEQRAEADRLYQQVLKRLKLLQQVSGEFED